SQGDVAWVQNDGTGMRQIYKLAVGATTPVAVTSDSRTHDEVALNSLGEAIWADFNGGSSRLYSTTRGQLTFSTPSGDHRAPALNNCGDVVFSTMGSGSDKVYRLGQNAPCLNVNTNNDSQSQATAVALGSVLTGTIDAAISGEEWFRFDLLAGQTVNIRVNYNFTPQNMLTMDLFESAGTTLPAQYGPMPGQMSYTATANGTYSLRLKSITGRFGYALSISRNSSSCGAEVCPDPVTPSTNQQSEPSINDLGEVVWSEYLNGYRQVFSSSRGQLTYDNIDHYGPVINNLGDIAWSESVWNGGNNTFAIKGIIAGQPVQLASNSQNSSYWLGGISDKGEVVWSLYGGSYSQVFSSSRGQLTFDLTYHDAPAISSQGDVAWVQNDGTGMRQIYKLAVGATTPVAVTSDSRTHDEVALNSLGEAIWADFNGGSSRLYSTTRGQLTFSTPSGDHRAPALNNCGDVVFSTMGSGSDKVYRLGQNAPCLNVNTNNDSQSQATAVALGSVLTGTIDAAISGEEWFRFDLLAGQTVNIRVNYNFTPQNMLTMDLFESAGTTLPAQYGPMPGQMSYTATANGTYSLRLKSITGRFGYALSISRNSSSCGAEVCPDPVTPSTNQQSEPSINDLGEVVWSEYLNGYRQVFSSSRGQLTYDNIDHYGPVINNLGDIAWSESVWNGGNNTFAIKGIIAGQPVQLASNSQNSSYWLGGISDKGEVVWSLYGGSYSQVFSSSRGQLTFDLTYHDAPAISSQGDVAWVQNDGTGMRQIYKLAVGATTPVAVTSDSRTHDEVALNSLGEAIWADFNGGSSRLYSTTRGQLTFSTPSGDHRAPALNNCGDVVFSTMGSGSDKVYRLGQNAPCLNVNTNNDSQSQATAVALGSVLTGTIDAAISGEEWFRF